MLLRTEFLSLDLYMRGRMSAAKSYAEPVEIGEPMVGGTVAQVVSSDVEGYNKGDFVLSYNGWQDYAISNGRAVTNLGNVPAQPSWALGIMGMPGFTACAGLCAEAERLIVHTLIPNCVYVIANLVGLCDSIKLIDSNDDSDDICAFTGKTTFVRQGIGVAASV